MPPAYRNLVVTHLMLQSSAVPCKPGAGICPLVLVKVSLSWGNPETSGAWAQGRAQCWGAAGTGQHQAARAPAQSQGLP